MKRIESIDVLRFILTFVIVFTHVGTFIVGYDNMTQFEKYLYSFTSLAVPLFFIISGYMFASSNNQFKQIYRMIKIYLCATFISMLLNTVFCGSNYNLENMNFFLLGSYTNYLWFINSLIYFMMILYCISNIIKNKFNMAVLLFILIIIINVLLLDIRDTSFFRTIIYFIVGYLIFVCNIKFQINHFELVFILLYPLIINLQYVKLNLITLVIAMVIFMYVKNIKVPKIKFQFYSIFGIITLVVQYYIIYFVSTKFSNDNYLISFIIIMFIVFIISYPISIIVRRLYV